MPGIQTARNVAFAAALATACGALLFGAELLSYAGTAFSSTRSAAREAVPVGFEIERARGLLAEVTPELHANLQRVAREEVEVEALAREVAAGADRLERQRAELRRRREAMAATAHTPAAVALLDRAAGVFEAAAEAQRSRAELLGMRREALAVAVAGLETTRARRSVLADRIDALAAQASVLEVAAAGRDAGVGLEASAFDRTAGLVDDLEKRLDVAERVLAKEAALFPRGLAPEPEGTADEVLARVDAIVGG